ncbi:hypothetical protein CLOM_g2809 [Closterium sp. NIES-68]|nr:hypothetical protein CLOM_g2809 [Closterium sp. NIES-68]
MKPALLPRQHGRISPTTGSSSDSSEGLREGRPEGRPEGRLEGSLDGRSLGYGSGDDQEIQFAGVLSDSACSSSDYSSESDTDSAEVKSAICKQGESDVGLNTDRSTRTRRPVKPADPQLETRHPGRSPTRPDHPIASATSFEGRVAGAAGAAGAAEARESDGLMAIRRPKLIRRVPVASGADSKAIGFQDTREYRRRERVSRRQSDPATTATTSPAASPPAAAAAPAASPTPAAAAAPPPPQPLKAVAPTRPQPAFAPTPPSSTSSIPSFPSSSSSSSSPSSSSSAPSPAAPQSTVWAHAATLLFQDMLLTRARPNHFTYTALINAYGRSGWFEDALAVFEHMKTCDEDDCRPNTVTCNALIGALCKGGMYDEAVEVFMDMRSGSGGLPDNCRPNIVTYNTLIDSLCREGQLDAALQVLDDLSSGALDPLVAPNIVTFNTIINACGKAGRAAEAETTLQAMELTGMAADGITYTALVDAYGRTGQVERAEEAFERMVQAGIGPDVFSYTALMAGFGRAGLPERVTETLSAMQRAGVQPNEVTFLTVLDAHGKAGNYEEAEATLAVMVTCGYRPSVYSWSCLIDAFGKAGLYAKAAGAFERMQAEGCRPNLITYAAILSACARCEQWEDALELLYCLQRTGGEWEVAMCRLVMAGPDEEGRTGRMFEAFQPLPLAMRRSFYNALADVLWSFGMHRRAARVVALGRGLGVYGGAEDMHKGGRGGRRGGLGRREGSSSGSEGEGGNQRGGGSGRGMWTEEGIWSVDLHEHSIGSACAFLFLWLRDLRTAWQWHNEIPEAIDIVTGWGRHSKRKDSTSDKPAQVAPLKAAILRELQQMGSPFQELSVNAGRLVAGGWAAYSWLLQEEMRERLQLRDAPQPMPPGDKPYEPQ